jgi:protein involved in polysaccharide export with SLBB domain
MSAALGCFLLFSSTEARPVDSAPGGQDGSELVHFGDLIDVDVVGSLEFDWRGTVTPEGFLEAFDKTDEQIFAICRSESDIAEAVTRAYSKFLRDPQIVVRIHDRSNRPLAYLDGAVRSPSRFRIKRPVSLRELIVQAGGFNDNASGTITIYRPSDLDCAQRRETNGDHANVPMSIKIVDLLRGNEGSNPDIRPGDVVSVLEAFPIYVVGGVNDPKQLSSRDQTTLSRAVAAAGGVSKQGIENKVTVYRRESGETQIKEYDLRKIDAKEVEDPKLKSYDIVEVAEKGRTRRKFPPRLEDVRSTATRRDKMTLKIVE